MKINNNNPMKRNTIDPIKDGKSVTSNSEDIRVSAKVDIDSLKSEKQSKKKSKKKSKITPKIEKAFSKSQSTAPRSQSRALPTKSVTNESPP